MGWDGPGPAAYDSGHGACRCKELSRTPGKTRRWPPRHSDCQAGADGSIVDTIAASALSRSMSQPFAHAAVMIFDGLRRTGRAATTRRGRLKPLISLREHPYGF